MFTPRVLVDLERFEDAVQHATRWIEENPKEGPWLTLRASAALELGRIDDAWRDLQMAHQIDPRHPAVLYATARCLLERDDPQAAHEAALAARDAVPFASESWDLVATSLQALPKPKAHAEALETALARKMELLRVEEAIQPLKQAWMRNPHDLEKLEAIAELHLQVQNLDRAEAFYERCAVWAREFGDQKAFHRALKALKDLR